MRLGDDRFYKYIRGFGFGLPTGIELPGETRGLSKPPNRWSRVSFAAISMGQEIGITPLQLVGLVSTMANDGVWVAPRIVAATNAPQSAPQTIAFHPAEQRRVISPLTAAQMRQMMQGVVLHGTGTKALLEGYTSAGKTGTAQKVDPATHAYSHSKYVASFAGFAPINDPVITVAVILDSAVGLHQGGQVSAPVFQRVAQQVLEYLHTPHDVELPRNRQVLLASRQVKDREVEEGSPDHLGDPLEVAEAAAPAPTVPSVPVKNTEAPGAGVVTAALKQRETVLPDDPKPLAITPEPQPPAAVGGHPPENGTVILDLEQNAAVVPSFAGKSVRAAIEMAQENGLDLDAVGSGLARDQSPLAGTHVPSGSKVTVRFGR
jgi:cell division protein FtsI (penicillin-binding protein 3)